MTDHELIKARLMRDSSVVNGPLDTPCLVWHGSVTTNGHGRLSWQSKGHYVHHLGFLLANGYKTKLFVLHRCDNPACWAGDHLFEGTQQDNVKDMINKGRVGCGSAKLNTDSVVKIKKLLDANHHTHQEIADLFNVTREAITRIKNNYHWRLV